MKQLLRGLLAVVVILGLTLAAVWLVRSAPISLRVSLHQATITSYPSHPTLGETSSPTLQNNSPNQITPAAHPSYTATFTVMPGSELCDLMVVNIGCIGHVCSSK